jgi:GDP-L-fucose synthase
MKIVTGGSGLLGNAFKSMCLHCEFPDSEVLELTNRKQTLSYFNHMQDSKGVESVIHLAGKVGGVKANTEFVSDFYSVNSAINNNVIDACISAKVQKLVCCLSTCIYPDEKYVSYPLTEDQLHNGPPHNSNFGYAYAKRMVDVQLRAARQQHGLKYISVVPNNMYGEHDNFDLENGHVIPSLIRKIWEAKLNNKPYFEVWGDGEIYREFTYAKDIAKIIMFCLEKYEDETPINIGSTSEYKLKDVISLIKKELDYTGEIVFDTSKPKGQVRKPSSNQKLLDLGWKKEWYTPLEIGLKNTCKWFINNYPNVRGMK